MKSKRLCLHTASSLLLVLLTGMAAWPAAAQKQSTPSPLLQFVSPHPTTEGDGYMVAGEFWEAVKPMNTNEENHLEDPLADRGFVKWIQIGPDGGNWGNPSGMWPGGFRLVNTWRDGKRMLFPVFEADGWPGYGPENVIRANGGDVTEDGRFMFAYYSPDLQGADDPSRNYKREARFTDRTRTHLVYEAGWPTTAGLDFKIRAHQYTVNEQNLNDFVALEITVTNTGVVDTNGDGTPEATGHTLDALGMLIQTLPVIAVKIGFTGVRRSNNFGAGRTFGYVATPDEEGQPYNLSVWYPNVPPGRTDGGITPPPGTRLFGVNDVRFLQGYTDVWNAWAWLGVKQGSIASGVDGNSPAKETLFGTHPIGEGSRRGWYTSQHPEPTLLNEPPARSDWTFRSATATWYEDYGRFATGGNPPDLAPNSNFFSGGTPDDVTTFTVGNPSARPTGDFKYASEDRSPTVAFGQPIWEDAWNRQAESGDFYSGVGFNRQYTFGNRLYSAIGPFGLDVGESITAVVVLSGGFRFEGVHEATEAARWAWNRGWDIRGDLPVPPAPDLRVESTDRQSTLVRWTDVSGIDPNIDGYKVWRAAQYRRTEWLEEGFRLVDRYHHQHQVGADIAPFLDPVNPYFDAEDEFVGDVQGTYQPAGWGTYDLIAKIPVGELDQYQDAVEGYDFAYEDEEAITGFTYWYYVSAYKEGSFTGPQGSVEAGHIESSNFTRNGRNCPEAAGGEIGLCAPWGGTYPFAYLNPDFPEEGTPAYQNLGAEFTVTPPVASVEEAAEAITVSPNPYKITGLNDVRSNPASHAINFLNMPENYTLTVIDVTGQIILQTTVEGAMDGQFTWDMFSKDGVEVASGLYIYHVAYGDGNSTTGHFAILR